MCQINVWMYIIIINYTIVSVLIQMIVVIVVWAVGSGAL